MRKKRGVKKLQLIREVLGKTVGGSAHRGTFRCHQTIDTFCNSGCWTWCETDCQTNCESACYTCTGCWSANGPTDIPENCCI